MWQRRQCRRVCRSWDMLIYSEGGLMISWTRPGWWNRVEVGCRGPAYCSIPVVRRILMLVSETWSAIQAILYTHMRIGMEKGLAKQAKSQLNRLSIR